MRVKIMSAVVVLAVCFTSYILVRAYQSQQELNAVLRQSQEQSDFTVKRLKEGR